MNLRAKKNLAAKTLGVGKGRIMFVEAHLSEIKEAITRLDILDLFNSGAIKIKEVHGRRKIVRRKRRRGRGKIKQTINTSKQDYVKLTRKLRTYTRFLLKTSKIDGEKNKKIRRMIRAKKFKSKRHLNEMLGEI